MVQLCSSIYAFRRETHSAPDKNHFTSINTALIDPRWLEPVVICTDWQRWYHCQQSLLIAQDCRLSSEALVLVIISRIHYDAGLSAGAGG